MIITLRSLTKFSQRNAGLDRRGGNAFQNSVVLLICPDIGIFHTTKLFLDGLLLFSGSLDFLLGNHPQGIALFPKAKVRIVLSKQKTILRPAGHHSIGLFVFLCHQVINQNPDIGLGTIQYKGHFPLNLLYRVDSCHKSLYRRLLIAGGAVHLSCKIQAGNLLRFQGIIQFQRI